MTPSGILDRIDRAFAERGAAEYHGEAVTQLEHALQCAALAEADGRSVALIVAALLHDIGHLLHSHGEDYRDRGVNDAHEERAAGFLHAFGPDVTEPVRLHVSAKRYLCATRAGYFAALSRASVISLKLQGGPMTPNEVAVFEANPQFRAAVAVREYDDRAKMVGLVTPPFAHFRSLVEEYLRAGFA